MNSTDSSPRPPTSVDDAPPPTLPPPLPPRPKEGSFVSLNELVVSPAAISVSPSVDYEPSLVFTKPYVEKLKARIAELEGSNAALKQEKLSGWTEMNSTEAASFNQELVNQLQAEKQHLEQENAELLERVADYDQLASDLATTKGEIDYLQAALEAQKDKNHKIITGNKRRQSSIFIQPHPIEEGNEVSVSEAKVQEEDPRIHFSEDSPFFRTKADAVYARVEVLGNRLKRLHKVASDFCGSCDSFADKCGALANELCLSWEDAIPAGQKLSLAEVSSKLADVLSNVKQISTHLMLSTDTMLVQSIEDFRQKHVKGCKETKRALQKAEMEYETRLGDYLNMKAKSKSTYWRKGNNASKEEMEEQLRGLRSKYELARFDHVRHLNELSSDRLLEIVELVCASFFGFITFFHEGNYMTTNVKPAIEQFMADIQTRKEAYSNDMRQLHADREKLIRGLSSPDFRVRDIFPPKEDEDEQKRAFVNVSGKLIKIEKQGYLLKQSSNLKKDWKRRWFALQEGQLFYFRSQEDLRPQHVVNVLVCSVRKSTKDDLRYCFELISPQQRTYTLQAESDVELDDWINTIRNCTESLLVSQSAPAPAANKRNLSSTTLEQIKQSNDVTINEVRTANNFCVDCGHRDPDWVSINLGVLMCIECSGIHRSLGVHISKVRSITLDAWGPSLLQMLGRVGNKSFNALYEYVPHPEFPKPTSSTSREKKEAYIRAKYIAKLFMNKKAVDPTLEQDSIAEELCNAASEDDIHVMMKLLAFGANVNWRNPADGRSPLHYAAEGNYPNAAEYLIQNNAKVNAKDNGGLTAKALAEQLGCDEVVELFNTRNEAH